MSSLQGLFRTLTSLYGDRRGATAMTFALASIPIMVSVGAAVDYSAANRLKARLDAVADAAVLSAVNQSAMGNSASSEQKAAVQFFKAQATSLMGASLGKVQAKVQDSTGSRTATLTYAATVPTAFMGLVGYSGINIGGSSTAASAVPAYLDFYLLLDNTPSMGVGATPADVAKMVANTPDQCAFACHDLSAVPNDYYSLAKKLGVTTRIDVVRSATQQLMDTAGATEIVPSQFQMAIYTFGATADTAGLTRIHPLSSTLTSAKTDAANIDLMTVPYQGYLNDQDTDFDGVLAAMNSEIPNPGDGSTPGKAKKILFFVTDGVADAYYPSSCSKPTTGGRCQEPLTVKNCAAMKNRGVTVAVLYTTYLQLPTNAWYMTWIDPFNPGPYNPSVNSQIAQNLQACATPGFYFEVSPTDGISTAMNALFEKVVQTARLTK